MSVPWHVSLIPISGGAVANHLWQSTFFALAVWLLTLLLRRNAARIRYSLWLAASLKFVVPFSLLIAVGGLLPQPRPTESAAPEAIYSAVDLAARPFAAWEPAPSPHSSASFAQLVREYLPGILVVLWIAGSMAVLLSWFLRWRRLRTAMRTAAPAESGRELELLREVEASLSARSPLPLRLSPELIEPGIFGIVRPVLVWPARLTEHLHDEHIEAILMHELVHARRRDNLTAALHMLVEAAFWFHPLVWWIGRRLVVERERACDEAVVQLGGEPEAYAESLLKACRFCIESPLPCVSGITGADLAERVRSIMTAAFRSRLSLPRKVLLVSAAFAGLAVPVVLGLVRFFPVSAQILHSAGPLPSFEVATIRPWQPKPAPMVSDGTTVRPQLPLRVDPGSRPHAQTSDQVQFIGEPILLIATAYNVGVGHEKEILGAPDWATQQGNRYEVRAKIEPSKYAEMQKMTPAEQRQQVELMEQSLLAERFKLKVHFESRVLPVYALVVSKGGAKLTPAKENENTSMRNTREDVHGMETTGTAVTLEEMSHSLILFGGKRVVDQTGLKGRYDFKLEWRSDRLQAADSESANDAPVLSTALREQMGLELVASKAPVEVVVIDHIEKPSVDGAEVQASSQASAQSSSASADRSGSKPLAFEVVSIRENKSGSHEGKMDATGDGWRMVNMPFEGLLQVAFVPQPGGPAFFPNGAIQGMPAWGRDRYDVVAKVPQSALADWKNSVDQPGMLHAMLQAMLAERCGLKVHREVKTIDILALVVAKGGPKLKPADPNAPPHPEASKIPGLGFAVPEDGGKTIRFYGANLALFTNVLDKGGALNVQDRTGLTGKYDFVIHMPDPPAAAPGETAAADDPRYFADEIAEQLGLKLVPAKGQVETLVMTILSGPPRISLHLEFG